MRFGFMHMVAANICVWIATTVKETHREFIMSGSQHPSTTAHSPSAPAAGHHSHEDPDSDDGKLSSELLTNTTEGELIASSVSGRTLYGNCPKWGICYDNFYLFVRKKIKKVKKGIAVCRQACHHRYGNSHAIWDHTVLPATRQR